MSSAGDLRLIRMDGHRPWARWWAGIQASTSTTCPSSTTPTPPSRATAVLADPFQQQTGTAAGTPGRPLTQQCRGDEEALGRGGSAGGLPGSVDAVGVATTPLEDEAPRTAVPANCSARLRPAPSWGHPTRHRPSMTEPRTLFERLRRSAGRDALVAAGDLETATELLTFALPIPRGGCRAGAAPTDCESRPSRDRRRGRPSAASPQPVSEPEVPAPPARRVRRGPSTGGGVHTSSSTHAGP